jgi:hypothetical protein
VAEKGVAGCGGSGVWRSLLPDIRRAFARRICASAGRPTRGGVNSSRRGGDDDDEAAGFTGRSESAPLLGGTGAAAAAASSSSSPSAAAAATTKDDEQAILASYSEEERHLLSKCALCHLRLADAAFLPCAHSFSCMECAKHVKYCAQCSSEGKKTVIKKRVKVYIS